MPFDIDAVGVIRVGGPGMRRSERTTRIFWRINSIAAAFEREQAGLWATDMD
jgi:hypothetical protein